MTAAVNRRIVLAARAHGRATADNFRLEEAPVPEPGPGQMLCRTIYLSLDPYMRGRMSDAPSYTRSVQVGEVMVGGTVGQVVRSNLHGFAPGDFVVGSGGWQEYVVFGEGEARKVDPGVAPISTALGVLGMPGQTAYVGLREIGRPKAGEMLVVAAASGPVGSVVGQIAKIRGCRVVGIAGSKAKCDYVSRELGFNACLDHHAPDFEDALRAACPDGIDVYWRTSADACSTPCCRC
jgi:NADPH-dependent curcumin reductase